MDSAIPCFKNKIRRALPHAKGDHFNVNQGNCKNNRHRCPFRDILNQHHSISTYNPHSESFIGECTIEAEAKNVIKYVARLRKETAVPVSIEIGYEAGPTGFGLKRELEKAGIRCHVMAPTSIYRPAAGVRVKTDARDARSLARAVYWGSYSEVMPLSEEDEAYRDYIRMRDDRHEELKRAKQHLLSFLLRRGKQYQGKNYWTRMHMGWLKKIEFRNPLDQLTFKEYLNEVTRLMDAIELLDAKIEEMSRSSGVLQASILIAQW